MKSPQELLERKEGRDKLAQVLNTKLDFPILNEEAEQDLPKRALDACADRRARHLIGRVNMEIDESMICFGGDGKELLWRRFWRTPVGPRVLGRRRLAGV